MIASITKICEVIGARVNGVLHPTDYIRVLLTDSRSLTEPAGTLFFAISTDSNSGERYIPALYAAGVRNFVVGTESSVSPEAYPNANILQVKSPVEALQDIGRWVRGLMRRDAVVIGITGSRGKTTVKEWLYQSLLSRVEVVRSPRSYNSQIGVPLSMWEIDPETTQVALIEAGVSQRGEMAHLADIIRPTIGVITNIGDRHAEGFGSDVEKCYEKCRLMENVDAVVYDVDSMLISEVIAHTVPTGVRRVTWNRKALPHYIHTEARTAEDIDNALITDAVLRYMGYSEDDRAAMVSNVAYCGTRIDVIEGTNECTMIVDNYTNDLHSLRQAIEFMARQGAHDTRPQVAILSDLVSNANTTTTYDSVASVLRTAGFKKVICVGSEISRHIGSFTGMDVESYTDTPTLLLHRTVSDFSGERILIKGQPDFGFSRIVERLEARSNETVLEVNLDAVAANFAAFRHSLSPGTGVVCMLKASGYGAGSYELAKTLQDRGAAYIAVAVVDEGADLRNAGITMPIMVLNPKVVDYRTLFAYRLEPEIFSLDMCREIINEANKAGVKGFPVHIKIDSGMHRLGFVEEQLPQLITLLRNQNAVVPASVFTHLAVADENTPATNEYTLAQLSYFERCSDTLRAAFPEQYIMRHALNTAGIIRFPQKQWDMVRLGIGLYGISPCPDEPHRGIIMEPVSSLHTIVISIKEWEAGTTIGYGRKGVLTRRSRIATIPVGYADGLNRRCGNGTVSMVVGGKQCPTVGNICMDACMIDVTDVPECRVGDSVEIFGNNNPVTVIAEKIGTIPYEILTSVSPRVKRVYYRE